MCGEIRFKSSVLGSRLFDVNQEWVGKDDNLVCSSFNEVVESVRPLLPTSKLQTGRLLYKVSRRMKNFKDFREGGVLIPWYGERDPVDSVPSMDSLQIHF